MVQIVEKKLIQLSKALCITLPQDWLRRFFLTKGGIVNLIVTDEAIVIVDTSTSFNAESIKVELDEAQKQWIKKEERKEQEWFNKLSPKEQIQVKKNWEETEKAWKTLEEGNGIHLDSPNWIVRPREPCDPETMKEWEILHPDLAKKEAEKAIERVRNGTPKQVLAAKNGKVDKEWLKTLSPEKIANLRKFWTEMLETTKPKPE